MWCDWAMVIGPRSECRGGSFSSMCLGAWLCFAACQPLRYLVLCISCLTAVGCPTFPVFSLLALQEFAQACSTRDMRAVDSIFHTHTAEFEGIPSLAPILLVFEPLPPLG